jgi:glucosamine-6-phosphate deaminase
MEANRGTKNLALKISIHENAREANAAAADLLAGWLTDGATRNVMPAAGNTPLELYRLIAEKHLHLRHLAVFTLDEYVGIPLDEPRSCSNLLRERVGHAWGIPPEKFNCISSLEADALGSVQAHERKIEEAGGLDVLILGLGQNGHLGFNEPGSSDDSRARVVDLEPISVEANRQWFEGRYAPNRGVTVGLRTILAARRILVLAYGSRKAQAVQAMVNGPRATACPASFLQGHPNARLFVDESAARQARGTS